MTQPIAPVTFDPVRSSAAWVAARPAPPPRVTRPPEARPGGSTGDGDDGEAADRHGERRGRPSTEEAIAEATPWWFDRRLRPRRDRRLPVPFDARPDQPDVDRAFEDIVRSERTRALPWARGGGPPVTP